MKMRIKCTAHKWSAQTTQSYAKEKQIIKKDEEKKNKKAYTKTLFGLLFLTRWNPFMSSNRRVQQMSANTKRSERNKIVHLLAAVIAPKRDRIETIFALSGQLF